MLWEWGITMAAVGRWIITEVIHLDFLNYFLFKYQLFKFILPGNDTDILPHWFFYGGAYNNSCHINCTSVTWVILIPQLLKRRQSDWSNLGILNLSFEVFLHRQDWVAELFSSYVWETYSLQENFCLVVLFCWVFFNKKHVLIFNAFVKNLAIQQNMEGHVANLDYSYHLPNASQLFEGLLHELLGKNHNGRRLQPHVSWIARLGRVIRQAGL